MTPSPQRGEKDQNGKKLSMGWIIKRWKQIAWISVLLILFLANRGFRLLTRNWLELHRLKVEESQIETSIQVKKDEWKQLSGNRATIERRARKELDYIKKGEIEYRFTPPNPKDS